MAGLKLVKPENGNGQELDSGRDQASGGAAAEGAGAEGAANPPEQAPGDVPVSGGDGPAGAVGDNVAGDARPTLTLNLATNMAVDLGQLGRHPVVMTAQLGLDDLALLADRFGYILHRSPVHTALS